jgi:hypothetical protein
MLYRKSRNTSRHYMDHAAWRGGGESVMLVRKRLNEVTTRSRALLETMLSQTNSDRIHTSYIFKTDFHFVLPSTDKSPKCSLPLRISD